MDQMYEVVSHVELYPEFVPWCKESQVFKRRTGHFMCSLTIGYPPLVERYTSVVTLARPNLVRVSINTIAAWLSLSNTTTFTVNFELILLAILMD